MTDLRISLKPERMYHIWTHASGMENLFRNKMFDRRGNLFIPRFKRKVIDSDRYFTLLIAYIHNNPVHHEFVSDPADWPHSSWHTYLRTNPTKLSRQEGTDWFGGAEAFVAFHRKEKNRDIILLFED